MQFIKPGTNIDFIGNRKIAFLISVTVIMIGLFSIVINRGLNYGVDFAGGTLIQVKFDSDPDLERVKSALDTIGLEKTTVQKYGEAGSYEYLLRTNKPIVTAGGFAKKFTETLSSVTEANVDVRRVEVVGPQVGKDLRGKALFAMFYAMLFITIYISGRFEYKWFLSGVMAAALMGVVYIFSLFNLSIPFLITAAFIVAIVLTLVLKLKYAMGAIIALVHDVVITTGMFSIMDKEFTLPIIAALLTIIGYSLNDTIIVFDRVRENLKKNPRKKFEDILNASINETLSRTILTSFTTLSVVVMLFIFGGDIIHDFAFAMIVGVCVGTYSSIYVAVPVLLFLHNKGEGILPAFYKE